MGAGSGVSRDDIKSISEMFKREFENFKNDKEVIRTMTIMEEKFAEGKAEGKAEAVAEYNARIEGIITGKIRNGEDVTVVKELAADLGISAERFNELLTAIKEY